MKDISKKLLIVLCSVGVIITSIFTNSSSTIYAEDNKKSLIALTGELIASGFTEFANFITNGFADDLWFDTFFVWWENPSRNNVYNDLFNRMTTLNLNSNNRAYYTDNNYNSTYNYSPITYNPITNTYDLTYISNNQTYNFNDIDINNTYITNVNNNYYYQYDITNQFYISISNTYNSTNIINNGSLITLYYQLPDGSNSLNLTEELAINGYKPNLSVGAYNNNVLSNDLVGLYHFDQNNNNSANTNNTISIVPNSIQYVNDDTNFNSAISFNNEFSLSSNTKNKSYSFRFYPLINNSFNISINGTNIGTTNKDYNMLSHYDEYMINNFVLNTGSSNTTAFIYQILINDTYYYSFNSTTGINNYLYTYDEIFTLPFIKMGTGSNYYFNSSYLDKHNFPLTTKPSLSSFSKLCYFTDGISITITNNDVDAYTTRSNSVFIVNSFSNARSYNYINNNFYINSGVNSFINLNMWNYCYIDIDGSVYINGIDTNIDIDNDELFNMSIGGDSTFYLDEFAIFNNSRSPISPNLPYSNNVYYTIPNNVINNQLLLQTTLSINSYKFGGVRQTNATIGDVYVYVDDYGFIKSIQIYDGVNWLDVKGAIYNRYLNLWITAIGFNILNNNWDYVEEQFNVSTDDGNVFIRFFKSLFQTLYDKLDTLINKPSSSGGTSDGGGDTSIDIEFPNIDIDVDINDLVDDAKNKDNDITLDFDNDIGDPTDTTNQLVQLTSTTNTLFDTLEDNGLSAFIYVPLILMVVGLIV